MVDIEEVGDLTGEELIRSAQLDKLETVGGFVVPLQPGEFTRTDTQRRWGWSPAKASSQLERMVVIGHLEKNWRYDPRTQRRVWGYRFVADPPGAETE